MTLLKKAVTFAAVAGVFALTITVAWAVNGLDPEAGRPTLVIDEVLAAATQGDPESSGIAQAIKSLDNKGVDVDKSSIVVVRVEESATPEIKSNDASLLFEGGIITWEDMAYLGSADLWQSLEVIDMRAANTLHSPDTAIWVRGTTITFPHLKEMYLPEGVAIISGDSFNDEGVAPYLEYIQFPTTLERIGQAFQSISVSADNTLKLVFTGSKPPAISDDAFRGVKIGAVIVPDGLEEEYAEKLGKLADNLAYIESIDVTPKSLVINSVDLSVDVTIFGKSLDLISQDIWIAVTPHGDDEPDVKSEDIKSGDLNLALDGENLVVPEVKIPSEKGQYDIIVYLDGKLLTGADKKATVTVTQIDPPGKNYMNLHVDDDKDTIKARAELYRADGTPEPEGVDVSFDLRFSTGDQVQSPRTLTTREGKIGLFELASALPDGLYDVTASATSYDEVTRRVAVGEQPVSTNPTDTGGGCSAAASPLLLIAAAAAMACKSKRR